VTHDGNGAETLVRVDLEHAADQILELLRVVAIRLVLRVGLPEKIRSVGSDELVVGVSIGGLSERRMS